MSGDHYLLWLLKQFCAVSLNQDDIICNDTRLRIIMIKQIHGHKRLSYATTNIIGAKFLENDYIICHILLGITCVL